MILGFSSILLIVITTGLIVSALIGFNRSVDQFLGSIFMLFLVGVLGWGLMGGLAWDYGDGYIPREVNIITTPTTIIALDNNNIPLATFNDVATYKMLSGKSNCFVYRRTETNMYRYPIVLGPWSASTNFNIPK